MARKIEYSFLLLAGLLPDAQTFLIEMVVQFLAVVSLFSPVWSRPRGCEAVGGRPRLTRIREELFPISRVVTYIPGRRILRSGRME